jgi:hypothetical protein
MIRFSVIMVDIINKISAVINKHEVRRHPKIETNIQRRSHSTSSVNGHIVSSDYYTNQSLRNRNFRSRAVESRRTAVRNSLISIFKLNLEFIFKFLFYIINSFGSLLNTFRYLVTVSLWFYKIPSFIIIFKS